MKYQILDVSENDALYNRKLVGKIGVGEPKKILNTLNSYSGGLTLPFHSQMPVYKFYRGNKTSLIDYYTSILSDQYLYFSNVKLKKVAN